MPERGGIARRRGREAIDRQKKNDGARLKPEPRLPRERRTRPQRMISASRSQNATYSSKSRKVKKEDPYQTQATIRPIAVRRSGKRRVNPQSSETGSRGSEKMTCGRKKSNSASSQTKTFEIKKITACEKQQKRKHKKRASEVLRKQIPPGGPARKQRIHIIRSEKREERLM